MSFIGVSAAQTSYALAHKDNYYDAASFQSFGYSSGYKSWFAAPTAQVDALLAGPSWSAAPNTAATISYSFNLIGADDSLVFSDNARTFSAIQQQIVKDVFDKIGEFTNITFTTAAGAGTADIFFYVGDLTLAQTAGVTAFFYDTQNNFLQAGVGIDTEYADELVQEGSYDYLTLLHEIGHSLGLKHPGDYFGGTESGPFLPSNLDNTDNTVMSYVDGDGNASTNPSNYQELDIDALQYLYGIADGYIDDDTDDDNDDDDGGNGDDDDDDDDGTVIPPDNGNGTPNNDVVTGSAFGDVLYGGRGRDTIDAGGGDDTLYGGQSIADGYDDGDIMLAGGGRDVVYGNGGSDSINGQDGNDTIYAGWGEDTIFGGTGDDFLAGGGGIAHPADNPDTIYGESGNDYIVSNGGNDNVFGGDGNDIIYGGLDNDRINGEGGSDTLYGQFGSDTLIGGAGSDRFFFGNAHGQDTITDFTHGEDKIQLRANLNGTTIDNAFALFADNFITYNGNNAVIQLSNDGAHNVTINNIGINGLNISDFDIIF